MKLISHRYPALLYVLWIVLSMWCLLEPPSTLATGSLIPVPPATPELYSNAYMIPTPLNICGVVPEGGDVAIGVNSFGMIAGDMSSVRNGENVGMLTDFASCVRVRDTNRYVWGYLMGPASAETGLKTIRFALGAAAGLGVHALEKGPFQINGWIGTGIPRIYSIGIDNTFRIGSSSVVSLTLGESATEVSGGLGLARHVGKLSVSGEVIAFLRQPWNESITVFRGNAVAGRLAIRWTLSTSD